MCDLHLPCGEPGCPFTPREMQTAPPDPSEILRSVAKTVKGLADCGPPNLRKGLMDSAEACRLLADQLERPDTFRLVYDAAVAYEQERDGGKSISPDARLLLASICDKPHRALKYIQETLDERDLVEKNGGAL